jgi:hypothetical protein
LTIQRKGQFKGCLRVKILLIKGKILKIKPGKTLALFSGSFEIPYSI